MIHLSIAIAIIGLIIGVFFFFFLNIIVATISTIIFILFAIKVELNKLMKESELKSKETKERLKKN